MNDSAPPNDTRNRRRQAGFRTARQNLEDLCDPDSFLEYGRAAVAAQRGRRSIEDLRANTAGDGIITGLATVNCPEFGAAASRCAVAICDYEVLAGTQGYFHHRKLDRLLRLAGEQMLPVVMFTEGGGGRPGDTDIVTQVAGLNVPSFALWGGLRGQVLRIAINNGYCFAGNAALFGAADIRIATRSSWIGMAGPAMIEGGGLGSFKAREIGPSDIQAGNGVIDVVAEDEAHATDLARRILGCFQGRLNRYNEPDQAALVDLLPEDRRYSYKMRAVINQLADSDSFIELSAGHGTAVITGLLRIGGRPLGLLANDPRILGGAIDTAAAAKAGRFLDLCNRQGLAVLSLCDTPGFMVGPDSEREGAVLAMSELFNVGANLEVPLIVICLRKAYGLGAMAMAGGGFAQPLYTASWPSGEFGAMGLEGAVRLGFSKELKAQPDEAARDALFEKLLAEMYEKGRALEAATCLEIDAVIEPADTRTHIERALAAAGYFPEPASPGEQQ